MGAAEAPEPPGTCEIFVTRVGTQLVGVAWIDERLTPVIQVIIEPVSPDDFKRQTISNPKKGLNVQRFECEAGTTTHIRVRAMFGGGSYETQIAGIQGTIDPEGVFFPDYGSDALPDGCSIQAHVQIPTTLPSQCRIPGQPPTS